MKVLQIIDSLNVGGTERICLNMAEVFSSAGFDNSVVCTREFGKLVLLTNKKTDTFCAYKFNFFDFFAFSRLVRYSLKYNPDIIHVHSTSLYWGVFLNFFINKKLVWHDHYGGRIYTSFFNKIVLKIFTRFVDVTIVVNKEIENWNKINLNCSKVMFYNNFTNIKLPEKQFIKPVIFSILLLANILPLKNQMMVLRVICLLRYYGYTNYKFTFIGKIYDEKYYNSLLTFIRENDLDNFVCFEHNILDIQNCIQKFDIGLLSSEFEGLPVSLLEYGIAGLPVLTTNVGECSIVLNNQEFGFVSNNNDLEYYNKLIHIILNYESAFKKGALLRSHIIKNYSGDNFLKKYLRMFENLL